MFVHPHVHSVFSIRDGLSKIEELVIKTKENGEAFALTDHGVIAGWMTYDSIAKQHKVKPIFGIEAYHNQYRETLLEVLNKIKQNNLEENEKTALIKQREELKSHQSHMVMIAKNETGFYNIIQLANEAYVDYFYGKPIIDYRQITKLQKDKNGSYGVIVTTACLAGPISKFVNAKKLDEAVLWIKEMKELFGDDFYLEVQVNHIKEQKVLNKAIVALAKKTKTKMIYGGDAHYIDSKDSEAHQDLLLLQNKKTRDDIGKFDVRVVFENRKGETKTKKIQPGKDFRKGYPLESLSVGMKIGSDIITNIEEVSRVWTFSTDNLYLQTEAEIRKDAAKTHKELDEVIDDVLKSNHEIYDKIEHVKFNTKVKLPIIKDADKTLVSLVKDGLKRKGLVERKYIDRVKYELDIIKRFNFETYFLILYDVIQFAKNNNIPLGVSRGSVAGSFIAYLIDLHRIDPFDTRWDIDGTGLPFERFLDFKKMYKTIIIESHDGETISLLENENVKIIRDEKTMIIKAIDLQENDNIID